MLHIIITTGMVASGKSTWAKDFVTKNINYKRFSRDDVRAMINGGEPWAHYKFDKDAFSKVESSVNAIRDAFIVKTLSEGNSIVIDDTNAKSRTFKDVVALLANYNFTVIVEEKPFYITYEEALKRDRNRTPAVGDDIVLKFWNTFEKEAFETYIPKKKLIELEFPKIEIKGTEKAVICDLDGTLALFGDRNPYDRDFENDEVNREVSEIIESFYYEQGYAIIFVSGRKETNKLKTMEFLKRAVIIDDYDLYMRHGEDNRNDAIVKYEIYKNHIAPFYDVKLVLDDRSRVVNMWRSLGLKCFQVADGDF